MLPEGKVTVITGAAQGIGFACAKRFVADGGKVMLSDIEVEKGAARAKPRSWPAMSVTRHRSTL